MVVYSFLENRIKKFKPQLRFTLGMLREKFQILEWFLCKYLFNLHETFGKRIYSEWKLKKINKITFCCSGNSIQFYGDCYKVKHWSE